MTASPKRSWRVYAEFSWAEEEDVGRAFVHEDKARAFAQRLVDAGAASVLLWQAADNFGHVVDNRIERLVG